MNACAATHTQYVTLLLPVASLCITAFEAPFYGDACEKGECPPGQGLESKVKVATTEAKCGQTVGNLEIT